MTEKTKKTIRTVFRIILVFAAIYFLLRLSLYCIPFIIAFILSSLIEPFVNFLNKKAKIPRRIGSAVSVLLVVGVLGSILGIIVSRLVREFLNLYNNINVIFGSMQEFIDIIINRISNIYISLPRELSEGIDQYISDIARNLSLWLEPLIKSITTFTLSLPQAIVFVVVTVLATYFMTSDREKIASTIEAQIPLLWIEKSRKLTKNLFSALFGYIRAQIIMMMIAFTEVSIGFLIMGVKNVLLLAFIIGILEALPIVGTGTVLIPWGIAELIIGNYHRGLSLLLLYAIVLVVRQLIEPKLVGHQIGVHPLLFLFSVYTGLQLIGVAGMLAGPIVVLILKNVLEGISKTGGIKDWLQKVFHDNPPEQNTSGHKDLHSKSSSKNG